jgi:fluoroquinolone resistance protein
VENLEITTTLLTNSKNSNRKQMERVYVSDEKFENINYAAQKLNEGDYEGCTFSLCDFSNTDLSHFTFIDCTFNECKLAITKLVQASFLDIKFIDCKLIGLHFDHCKSTVFAASFERCTLNMSSFYQMKLKKFRFENCILHEVDFAEADLTEADFTNSELTKAVFENTILEKADFRKAVDYSINPGLNRIKKAKFSSVNLSGLLDNYDIDIS